MRDTRRLRKQEITCDTVPFRKAWQRVVWCVPTQPPKIPHYCFGSVIGVEALGVALDFLRYATKL